MKPLTSYVTRLLAAMSCVLCLGGCSGLIYQDEGDCDPHYRVRFVYDWNMAFADAFSRQVSAVTLYLVDTETGKVVWSRHESGDALAQPGYAMDVDVAPGVYHLMAWCGKGHRTHFSIPDSDNMEDLHCMLLTQQGRAASDACSQRDLDPLFHGLVMNQEFTDRQGTHVYTVPLVKNTNNIQIVLQHLSGAPVDAEEFTFAIDDDNAHLSWDNSVVLGSPVTYYQWVRSNGVGSIVNPEDGIEASYSAAKAELSTSRLLTTTAPRLTVTRRDGSTVFSIPLKQWCLAFKSQHLTGADGRPMSDQEFLDRQDDWHMVFFLDDGDRWVDAFIYINSFKVVNQRVDL